MSWNSTKAKIYYFSKTTAKKEKSVDEVPETSESPAASESSSIYKSPASAGLEENNSERQRIE